MEYNQKTTSVACEAMMRHRKWSLLLGIPFVVSIMGVTAASNPGNWYPILLPLIFAIPMWLAMFRIVRELRGSGNAILFVAASITLTPVFLVGILLIPIVVRGDLNREILQAPIHGSEVTR